MKFIIDAHLPMRLKDWLIEEGHDAIHTRNLPDSNATDDFEVIVVSMDEKRVVVSKDKDFYNYYVLKQKPYKLLMLTTGNLRNKELIELFEMNFTQIHYHLSTKSVVELSRTSIIVHY